MAAPRPAEEAVIRATLVAMVEDGGGYLVLGG